MTTQKIAFPAFAGLRCLMMPFIQGRPETVPDEYRVGYDGILDHVCLKAGQIGYLTIDESLAQAGTPHRGTRARWERALHTEAGRSPNRVYGWGTGGGWGSSHLVTLDRDVRILLANNLDDSCALWNAEHENTSLDGDIGDVAHLYPYSTATLMKAGEVHEIGILTPHESLPVQNTITRQFLRIVGSGVHGREAYFTENPKLKAA